MLKLNNGKLNARKMAAVIALAVLFEAAVFSSSEVNLFQAFAGKQERGTFAFIRDLLKDKRTGLGSREEFKLAQVIHGEAIANSIDPLFVLALIETESTFYNWSRSMNGAVGLMQILPSTGEELAGEMRVKWDGEETLLNPFVNVKMGIRYFSNLREMFDDDIKTSLAAYNAGPGYVSVRRGGPHAAEGFVKRVLDNYEEIKERAETY